MEIDQGTAAGIPGQDRGQVDRQGAGAAAAGGPQQGDQPADGSGRGRVARVEARQHHLELIFQVGFADLFHRQ